MYLCYGAAPPALRVLRIALRATALRAALTPETSAAPWARKSGRAPGLPLAMRAARNPRWRGHETHVEGKPVKNPSREMSRIK